MGYKMRCLMIAVLLPFTSYASIPDFQCWDIHNDAFSTDGSIYATRYTDKMPPPYGSYHYETAPNEQYYKEIVITNERFGDGYYYGTSYMNKEGTLYNDIKCKPL